MTSPSLSSLPPTLSTLLDACVPALCARIARASLHDSRVLLLPKHKHRLSAHSSRRLVSSHTAQRSSRVLFSFPPLPSDNGADSPGPLSERTAIAPIPTRLFSTSAPETSSPSLSEPHPPPGKPATGSPHGGAGTGIFNFFDNISHLPKVAKTYRMAIGVAGHPKTVFSGKKRKGAAQSEEAAPVSSMEAEYLSVGVGEDAYFKREDAVGVADGVGGWGRVQGSNAAMYSRKLMHYAAVEIGRYDEIHDQHDMDAFKAVDPKEVLKRAYDDLNGDKEKENILGSTTALIALLRTDRLRIANLGDCGLIVLRDQDIYFRTEEQQHSFNFPYQLGTGSRDVPDDAEKCDIDVQEGDIVVVGSDGLFDNLFDDDIVEIVRSCTDDIGIRAVDADPQEIADALVERTRQIQEDPSSVTTPFQVKAVDEGLYHEGGKQDDTTCVVGIVKLDQDSPDRR